jgi:cell division protein FtsZ
MQDAGTALMGIGRASGENRASEAAKAAISSPLLEMTIDGAKGVLFNITGGKELGMFEIDEAAKTITKSIDPDAKVKFGAVIDEAMGDEIRITVIATGFDEGNRRPTPSHFAAIEETPLPTAPTPVEPPKVEVRKPLFTPKPMEAVHAQPVEPEDNDELDIPAFIRKKMR